MSIQQIKAQLERTTGIVTLRLDSVIAYYEFLELKARQVDAGLLTMREAENSIFNKF